MSSSGCRLAVLAIVVVVAVGAHAPAHACINAVLYSGDEAVRGLTVADRHLAAGRANRAFIAAVRVLWQLEDAEGLRDFGYEEGVEPSAPMQERSRRRVAELSERAKRLLAIAAVRLDGATTFEPPHAPALNRLVAVNRTVLRAPTDEQRQAGLRWALGVLEAARTAQADDPIATAHFAEALGALPERRAEGIRLLSDLAARDLVPDAWAYRALANMMNAAADPGRDQAVQRCRDRAGRQARRICPRFG